MRTIALSVLVAALSACGAQPNQPLLANAPRPNPSAVAGGAAAAAAAITLADPDAASRRPEKKDATEKKPIEVKENVPAAVLDRLDQAEANKETKRDATTKQEQDNAAQPAGSQPTAPKPPRDALDFGQP